MNKDQVLKALKELREKASKRNFIQSVDLIIKLKFFDIKKDSVDQFILLPHGRGKKINICAFVDKELVSDAKKIFDFVIPKEEFHIWKEAKKVKKLAKDYDLFAAQANIMGEIASVFGKVLGPRNKMPSPKANAIIAPKQQDLKPVYDRLQKTVRIFTKNEPSVKCVVGTENMKDEELSENIINVYNSLVHSLPSEEGNLDKVLLKFTMSNPIIVGEKNA